MLIARGAKLKRMKETIMWRRDNFRLELRIKTNTLKWEWNPKWDKREKKNETRNNLSCDQCFFLNPLYLVKFVSLFSLKRPIAQLKCRSERLNCVGHCKTLKLNVSRIFQCDKCIHSAINCRYILIEPFSCYQHNLCLRFAALMQTPAQRYCHVVDLLARSHFKLFDRKHCKLTMLYDVICADHLLFCWFSTFSAPFLPMHKNHSDGDKLEVLWPLFLRQWIVYVGNCIRLQCCIQKSHLMMLPLNLHFHMHLKIYIIWSKNSNPFQLKRN